MSGDYAVGNLLYGNCSFGTPLFLHWLIAIGQTPTSSAKLVTEPDSVIALSKAFMAPTGDRSAASNTGDRSAASVEGKESVAIVTGHKSKAKASKGSWIVLTERNDEGEILDIKTAKVGGNNIKADAWYQLIDGQFVEAAALEAA